MTGRAPEPSIATATGSIRTSVRLSTAYSASSQVSSVSAGPSRIAPKSTNVIPLRMVPICSPRPLSALRIAPVGGAEHRAGHERRDEAGAVQRDRDPVGERGAGDRDHRPPLGRDQATRAGVGQEQRDQQTRDDAARARRSRVPRPAASPRCGRRRSPTRRRPPRPRRTTAGRRSPSLSPLSTLSPWRIRSGTRSSLTTACPSAASVGARTTPRITASQNERTPKIAAAAIAPSAIVSGRPMPSSRSGTPTARRRCLRSIRDASQNSTSASVASASVRTVRARARNVDPLQRLRPDQQPERDEQHRRR